MTNQQILTKAIQKAQASGFMTDHRFNYSKDMGWTYVLREEPKQSRGGINVNVTGMLSESDIIYDHDFAKALWGESQTATTTRRRDLHIGMTGWKFHLQQMVITDDPIKYLGENI